MKLYYFSSERYGLEAIRDRRLKIARINELNDPFEWLAAPVGKDYRRILNNFKNDMDTFFGLLCLSENWQHPLLWGHYADKHKGICLGFNVTEQAGFSKILYVPNRTSAKLLPTGSDRIVDVPQFEALAFTKFDGWAYEAEYRVLRTLRDKDPVSGLYFNSFNKDMQLSQVIVGARSKVTRSQLKETLGSNAGNVECFKARPAFKKFEVVENKLKRAWK